MADFEEKVKKVLDTKDTTSEYDAKDVEDNKVMAVLSYIWLLFLVPLFAAKDSKFARFHCNQGIVLAIVGTVGGIIFSILSGLPFIRWLFSIVGGLFGLACFILMIIGIVNAVNGKVKELPVIGGIRILK